MKKAIKESPVRVGLISLGCAKNLVDAEMMLGSLLQSGVEITSDATQADVVIVNTCSFIDAAQEESVEAILDASELRESTRPDQGLIVAGCLPQRFRNDLPQLLPEVDAFIGIDQVTRVPDLLPEVMRRRAERLRSRGQPVKESAKSRPRRQLMKKLQDLDEQAPEPAKGASLRGTPQFNHTRTVLGGASPAGALVDVDVRPRFIPDYATPRFRLTPRHFAYLKIAEGCNHPCSFCIIPRMRGGHRSRPQADIVEEARRLIDDGVKEINLISQDTTYYGLDFRRGRTGSVASPDKFRAAARVQRENLCSLLRALNALKGDFWIRLLYTHPAHWTDELIQTIADSAKVARYIDMPLQHFHPLMLERMRRETSDTYIRDLIASIRKGVPGIALRTTFIVGFPGETESCFETLLDFIRETKFERVGIFTYSQEDGTLAGRMAGQIPDEEKRRRRDRAMALQCAIARELNAAMVGRKIRVLLEKPASPQELKTAGIVTRKGAASKPSGYTISRGQADAPDIDGRVYIAGAPAPGDFLDVRVTGHTDYDLIAEPVKAA